MTTGRCSRLLSERLWPRTRRASNGCLEWLGGVNSQGRGVIGVRDNSRPNGIRMEQVHRAAWTLIYGLIPENVQILHHCDNPLCCEVVDIEHHCYTGDYRQNAEDRSVRGRHHMRIGLAVSREMVLDIRLRASSGELQNVIAKFYNLSPQNISRIVLRQTWQNV